MITFNNLMKDFLNKNMADIEMPDNLKEIIEGGFYVSPNGCTFFAIMAPKNINASGSRGGFFDKTDEECFYNKIRIGDYSDEEVAGTAIKFAFLALDKLKSERPDDSFELIVAIDEFEGILDAVVKLHTIREDEAPYIEINNLEDFSQPILLLRT